MTTAYAYEKFYRAVASMAQGSATLPERLESAYLNHIMHVVENEIPADNRGEFRELRTLVSGREPRHSGEGSIQATVAQMSSEEVERAAQLIVKLFDHIQSAYWGNR